MGNFNYMFSEDEKMGGLPLNKNRLNAFRNYMDTCGLRILASRVLVLLGLIKARIGIVI